MCATLTAHAAETGTLYVDGTGYTSVSAFSSAMTARLGTSGVTSVTVTGDMSGGSHRAHPQHTGGQNGGVASGIPRGKRLCQHIDYGWR
ncbi:hypothetical protein FACS189430_05810 [Bacteroidia bacterium]|nr:hypothetical protein FACS189430_05810 [Bacteroidia bacterium]